MRAGAASPVPNGSRRSSRQLRRAGGQVAVLFAIAAVAIVAVVGLAFDAGRAYVDQRALQAAADTASDGGARILAQDYQACMSGSALPYDATTIYTTATTLVSDAVAGPGRETSYTVSLTNGTGQDPIVVNGALDTPSSTTWCSDWQTLTQDSCGGDTTPPPTILQGVTVTATDTHPTQLLPVIGIPSSTESATATSVFQVGCGSGQRFVAFYYDCTTNTLLQTGDPVYFHSSSHWEAIPENSCGSDLVQNSKFKGDLKLENLLPSPISVPGWVSASPGTGSSFPQLSIGEKIWIPMVDVICTTPGYTPDVSPCVEPTPYANGATGPYCGPWPAGLPQQQLAMCTVAQVEVTVQPSVEDPTKACGPSLTCWGTVDSIVWGTPGSTIQLGLQGVKVVELYQ